MVAFAWIVVLLKEKWNLSSIIIWEIYKKIKNILNQLDEE